MTRNLQQLGSLTIFLVNSQKYTKSDETSEDDQDYLLTRSKPPNRSLIASAPIGLGKQISKNY